MRGPRAPLRSPPHPLLPVPLPRLLAKAKAKRAQTLEADRASQREFVQVEGYVSSTDLGAPRFLSFDHDTRCSDAYACSLVQLRCKRR